MATAPESYSSTNLLNKGFDPQKESFQITTKTGESVDVFIQDQTTPPIEYFLTKYLFDVEILTSGTTRNLNIIELVDASGTTIGDYIEIKYVDYDTGVIRFFQTEIYNIIVNDIYLSIPLDFDLLDLTKIETSVIVTADMNVNGSVTPQDFSISPQDDITYDLTRMMVEILTDNIPDDALFGDLTRLTKGIYFAFENDLGVDLHLVNIKTNGDFRLTAYDVDYQSRSHPASAYGISVRKSFAGQDKYGVAIRLEGQYNDKFFVEIQDDLTDLVQFRMKVMGHLTQD